MQRAREEVTRAREYLRVSRDLSGRERSVEEQHDDNVRAAEENGWSLGEPYRERAVSASRYSKKVREVFGALMADLEAGRFGADVLILWESSRGSRKVSEWAKLIETCEEHGVRIHVTKDHHTYDLSRGRDRRSLHEDATDSEYESSKISDRTRRPFANNAAKGLPHGRLTWGYLREYDPKTKELIQQYPDPDRAPIIQDMARRALAGEALYSIAKSYSDTRWTPMEVRRALLRPTYAGLRVHQGKVVGPAAWAPIISEADHYALVDKLTAPERRTFSDGSVKNLLTNIARCGVCGGPCRRVKNRGTPCYMCMDNFCATRTQWSLDQYVIGVVCTRLAEPDVLDVFIPQDDGDAHQAAEEARTKQGRLDTYIDQAAAGEISPTSFAKIETRLLAEIAEAKRRSRPKVIPQVVIDTAGPHAAERFEALTVPQQREVIRTLMTVVILPVGKGRRRGFNPDYVRVEWKTELPES